MKIRNFFLNPYVLSISAWINIIVWSVVFSEKLLEIMNNSPPLLIILLIILGILTTLTVFSINNYNNTRKKEKTDKSQKESENNRIHIEFKDKEMKAILYEHKLDRFFKENLIRYLSHQGIYLKKEDTYIAFEESNSLIDFLKRAKFKPELMGKVIASKNDIEEEYKKLINKYLT